MQRQFATGVIFIALVALQNCIATPPAPAGATWEKFITACQITASNVISAADPEDNLHALAVKVKHALMDMDEPITHRRGTDFMMYFSSVVWGTSMPRKYEDIVVAGTSKIVSRYMKGHKAARAANKGMLPRIDCPKPHTIIRIPQDIDARPIGDYGWPCGSGGSVVLTETTKTGAMLSSRSLNCMIFYRPNNPLFQARLRFVPDVQKGYTAGYQGRSNRHTLQKREDDFVRAVQACQGEQPRFSNAFSIELIDLTQFAACLYIHYPSFEKLGGSAGMRAKGIAVVPGRKEGNAIISSLTAAIGAHTPEGGLFEQELLVASASVPETLEDLTTHDHVVITVFLSA